MSFLFLVCFEEDYKKVCEQYWGVSKAYKLY